MSPPWIFFSVKQNTKTCDDNKCVYNIDVNSKNVDEWSLTTEPASDQKCESFFVSKVFENVIVDIEKDGGKVYFCVKSGGLWHHQGEGVYLDTSDVIETDL